MEDFDYFNEVKKEAMKASCERARCGSVIVKEGVVIGRGFNSPPNSLEEQRRCKNEKSKYNPKVTDKTCCVHAEQRAIFDALRNNPGKILGSVLYFARIDEEGEIKISGKPYCTICSKMALDAGIKEFVLWHEDGIKHYDTSKYNTLSFEYS